MARDYYTENYGEVYVFTGGREYVGRAAENVIREQANARVAARDAAETREAEKPYDLVGNIMAYESGEMDDDQAVEFFQHIINSGMVWSLQGSYGHTAQALIDAGLCHP